MGKRRGRREVRGASWDPVYALERAIVVDVSNREGTVYAFDRQSARDEVADDELARAVVDQDER